MAYERKVTWRGIVIGVQPRIRLTRSFDQRFHTYQGYALRLGGRVGDREGEFLVGVGKDAQRKHQFRAGDSACGESHPVPDRWLEGADFYKTSKLTILGRQDLAKQPPPPWAGVPPDLESYRKRGHRRLDARTYESRCTPCIWGCQMPVEMIIDQWNPKIKKYRFETFCYGPKSCSFYQAGPTRKVPGRRGMTWEEEDWVDEDATSHRGMDE